jgi:hypothetical protein
VPDDRTLVTELATALGMFGAHSLKDAIGWRPDALHVTHDDWERLVRLAEGSNWTSEIQTAFENGRAFLRSPDALRDRVPINVEWTGGRRPPGDEVAPIDLRIDHVFLVSCKYLSANIANPSPGRLFDGLLATTGSWTRGDWYLETAREELCSLYLACRQSTGLDELPEDPAELDKSQRAALRHALPPRSFPSDVQPLYKDLCRAVSEASARRWISAIEGYGKPEHVFWRLLRIGSAPYFLLGVDARQPLQLRVASPWDWRQSFRFLDLTIAPASAGQPQVDWVATYETRDDGQAHLMRGHVEVRWSHGRFTHPPEAKIYLDTPTNELPGYFPLSGPHPASQPQLRGFEDQEP